MKRMLYQNFHKPFVHQACLAYRKWAEKDWPEEHMFTKDFVLTILDEIIALNDPVPERPAAAGTATDQPAR